MIHFFVLGIMLALALTILFPRTMTHVGIASAKTIAVAFLLAFAYAAFRIATH